MQFVLQNSFTLLVVVGKIPQNKHKEYQNMHFGNHLVESQTKSPGDIFLKTPKQSGKHACPWCFCGLGTVTCAGSDGVHAWERHCLLLLQKQTGQHA